MFKITTDPTVLNGLRGNMRRCCEHAANGASRVGLTRGEIVANKKAADKRAKVFENVRFRLAGRPTDRRVAQVKREGTGFHVVGLGHQELTLNELKQRLDGAGYTDYRYGKGNAVNLAKTFGRVKA